MGYKSGQIFDWGQKAKVLEASSCLAPLNSLQVFKGTLKIATLKDRWRKAEKIAEDIMGDEEKFLKLAQNGGKALSELDSMYFSLAKKMKKHSN